MSKLVGLACTAMILLSAGRPQGNKFSKYQTIEAYEIRPEILMMPRYSDDGQVCEIGLERRHYFPEKVNLDSDLSRDEIDQIADELAPANERGARTMGKRDLTLVVGHAVTTISGYENISIQIYYSDSKQFNRSDFVAIIKWKNRKCSDRPPGR